MSFSSLSMTWGMRISALLGRGIIRRRISTNWQWTVEAYGFRSFENYRTRILFFCGKLDMMPAIHSPATDTKT
jgi:hypothetical protein